MHILLSYLETKGFQEKKDQHICDQISVWAVIGWKYTPCMWCSVALKLEEHNPTTKCKARIAKAKVSTYTCMNTNKSS